MCRCNYYRHTKQGDQDYLQNTKLNSDWVSVENNPHNSETVANV